MELLILTRYRGTEDSRGLVSSFPEFKLVAGQYTVSVWQVDCFGANGAACGDLQLARDLAKLDLCTLEFELAENEIVDLVATWTPGAGCDGFAPPAA